MQKFNLTQPMEEKTGTHYFVQFMMSGDGGNYLKEVRVADRDATKIKLPTEAVAFRFVTKFFSAETRKTVHSKPFDVSGWYFKGTEYDIEDVKNQMPVERYKKLHKKGYHKVVKTPNGEWYGVFAKDFVM